MQPVDGLLLQRPIIFDRSSPWDKMRERLLIQVWSLSPKIVRSTLPVSSGTWRSPSGCVKVEFVVKMEFVVEMEFFVEMEFVGLSKQASTSVSTWVVVG